MRRSWPDLGCCATETDVVEKNSTQDITNCNRYSYVGIVFPVSTVKRVMLGLASAVSFDTAKYSFFFCNNLLTRM